MENSLLIGLSRQQALGRQFDVVANNLANMRTTGFKSESLIFEEFIMPVAQINDARLGDKDLSYVIERGMSRDFTAGEYQRTGNDLDVAISGKGWFVVDTPEGERYTRDGGFEIGPGGQLVTSAGHIVQGTGGPIIFDANETGISIAADGTISSSAGEKGQIRVVSFENEASLNKEGSNLFSSSQPAQPAVQPHLLQGMLEGSNVKPVLETTRMMEVTRAYTSTAQMMEQLQELRRDAIGQLASVPT